VIIKMFVDAEDNQKLDILDWTGISPTQRGVFQIEVTFDKTKNGAKGCHMAVSDERSDNLTVAPMPQLQTADSNELSAFTFITNCLIAHQPNDVQCLQGLWAISMPLLEQRRVRLGAKHAQFWLRRQGERDAANSCADTLQAGKIRADAARAARGRAPTADPQARGAGAQARRRSTGQPCRVRAARHSAFPRS
jgi:hypothetical protein